MLYNIVQYYPLLNAIHASKYVTSKTRLILLFSVVTCRKIRRYNSL